MERVPDASRELSFAGPVLIVFLSATGTTFAYDTISKVLSSIATDVAIDLRTERVFPIQEKDFTGKLKAIDVRKTTRIDVQEFNLSTRKITARINVKGRFQLKGQFLHDGGKHDIETEAMITITPSMEASLIKHGWEFYIRPVVTDLDIKSTYKN